ncbi:hypothetical protein DERP_000837 [Dermatophagoides pteronyssinus]|uniref:Uncharacterized protein n=1 Tax=Dermatophagoides pteronyssinus TaxID=6956 RepID=A0ABQ8J198_DERPT|nr:hypothetical protein DERP_000837 [Dermatophagoides pteronyssinus]
MLAIKDDCKLHLLSIQTRIVMRIDSKEIKTAKKSDLSSDFDKHIKPKTRSIYNGNGNNTNLVIY